MDATKLMVGGGMLAGIIAGFWSSVKAWISKAFSLAFVSVTFVEQVHRTPDIHKPNPYQNRVANAGHGPTWSGRAWLLAVVLGVIVVPSVRNEVVLAERSPP